MIGTLYIVATPIGNLEDISQRAIETLKKVDLILCEDTRQTSILLRHYEIDRPSLSYHQHSSISKKSQILNHLIKCKNLALVSDSGTPGISDPGNELINYLLESNSDIKIIPIPGPSAVTTTLSVSGFRANKFVFLGFWPKKKRLKLVGQMKEIGMTFVFYESPKRIIKTLGFLAEHLNPDTRIFVAREMTKIHETLYRGTIAEVLTQLKEKTVKGEIVVVVEV